ncbi:MAG: hypothetical protein R6V58_03750 [Planctomycetota bacterium]
MRARFVSLGLLVVLAAGLSGCAGAGGAALETGPTAAVEGKDVRVTFTAAEPTDVAVLVKDARGRIVRHLAAGVLGPNAPDPLKPNSLTQSLVWDGRDDDGRCLPPGQYKIEVKVGLTPRFDKALGWNPYRLGTVHGLAFSRAGELYVMSAVGRDSMDGVYRVFSADGTYRRTVLPRSGNLPIERVRPLGEVVLEDGEHFPGPLLPQYGMRRYQAPVVTPDGDLIVTNCTRTIGHGECKRFRSIPWRGRVERRLLRIARDGGAPEDVPALGPVLGKGFDRALVSLALGPDERVYVSGARHAVFRVAWKQDAKPEPFVGTPDEPGGGEAKLRDPCGIGFDLEGNLYVADRGNHRIAVFDRDGKLTAEIPVQWPRQLIVDKRTRAIYVAAGYKEYELLKFESLEAKKPMARYDLRSNWPFLALDPRHEQAVLYVANVRTRAAVSGRGGKVLVRLVDMGDEFKYEKELSDPRDPRQPLLNGVDADRELVYGTAAPFNGFFRVNGRSGRIEQIETNMHPKANGITEITAGRDGTVIVHVTRELGRMDHHLEPYMFSHTGTYIAKFPREDCVRSYYPRDCCVAPNGDLYVLHERGGYSQPMRCSALHVDGTVKKDSLIVFETRSPAGIRVDRAGNIYVLDHLKPLGKPVPDELRDVAEMKRLDRYVHHYGSLLKFRPEGGRVTMLSAKAPQERELKPGQMQFTTAEGRGDFVTEGALWSYYGVSMIRPALNREGCQCWTPRFDLDGFARVFVPDQLRCRIVVLDKNGNEITTFGRYGNPDDGGRGIPLADPRSVTVSDEAAYIGDMTNQRIVRAALDYEDSGQCTVTLPGRTLSELANEFAETRNLPARRETLRLLNAETRVAELQEEAAQVSPTLLHRLDWDSLVMKVAGQAVGALANIDDARVVLAQAAPRQVPDWPENEARALLGKYLEDGSERLRLAVCWGLWQSRLGGLRKELLEKALADESELVKVTAAYVLLENKDPSGLAVLMNGALSEEPYVYKMAETAILTEMHPGGFAIGKPEVEALSILLGNTRRGEGKGAHYWYLRRAAILMLTESEDPEGAATSLLAELGAGDQLTGNNLNRVLRGLGRIRSRKAVPKLVWFVARGRAPHWRGGHGDRAESIAATALARIADPKSVAPLITLLTSKKPGSAENALRALSLMFDPDLATGKRLVPEDGKPAGVRVDELPANSLVQKRWQAFWQENEGKYVWDPDGPPLKKK